MTQRLDLTQGRIAPALVALALPLLGGAVVQQLYGVIDLAFAGNFIGANAAAAIGASSMLVTCIIGFLGGLAMGAEIVIARRFGASDTPRVDVAIHSCAFLCLVCGVALELLGLGLAEPFLNWVAVPGEIFPDALVYLRIYLLSVLPMVVYNFTANTLIAFGDSKRPLIAQAVGALVNLLMAWVFVAVAHAGVAGVAWATFIAQTVVAVIGVVFVMRLPEDRRLEPRRIAYDAQTTREVLAIGIPAGMQSLAISLSNVIAQYHINELGQDAIAAYAAYFKVELVIYMPIVAMGQAVMAFVAQNHGCMNYGRIRRGTLVAFAMSACLTLVLLLACLAGSWWCFRLFAQDASVIALGQRAAFVSFPFYWVYCILQIFGDSMRGLGLSRMPFMIVFTNICVVRTVLLFALVPVYHSVEAVAWTYPITWALTAVGMLAFYAIYHHRRRQVKP